METISTMKMRSNSLLKSVQSIKKIDKKIKKIIATHPKSLWFSTYRLIIVVLLVIFYGVLSYIHHLSFYIKDVLCYVFGSKYIVYDSQSLITIHAGIGALLIALAFLIAQEVFKEKTTKYPYRSFIILKRSYFFPLLVAEILCFFIFLLEPIWGSINIFCIVPIIGIGTRTIFSLKETFNLISDDFELKEAEKILFFKRIQHSFLKTLDIEITKKIGNDLFYQKFKKHENLINITPYSPVYKEEYTEIKSKKIGFCKDINLKNLEKFLRILKQSAPSNKKIFSENQVEQNIQKDYEKDHPYCYLEPKFFSFIRKEDNRLIWIRTDIINRKNKTEKIKNTLNKIFTIIRSNFNLEKVREQVKTLKYFCLEFVHSNEPDKLREGLVTYNKLIESAYSYLNGGFSEKQAQNLSFSIAFGNFSTVQWIKEDIDEIFKQSIKSNNKKIIKEVTFLIINMMRLSIEHRDHLIFQQFQYYPSELYHEAKDTMKAGKSELADFLFSESRTILKELSKYYLEPKLKNINYPKEEFKIFATSIIKIYQDLLKLCFDKQDVSNFKKYLHNYQKLFEQLDVDYHFKTTEVQNIFNLIKGKKEEMLFGLASWILYKYFDNQAHINKQFYDLTQETLSVAIEEFTEIFLKSFHNKDSWQWATWELLEKEDKEKAYFIETTSKLHTFYIVKGLSLLEGIDNDMVQNLKLPTDKYFSYITIEAEFMEILQGIKEDSDSWKNILSDDGRNKIDSFKNLLRTSFSEERNRQLEKEAIKKRIRSISKDKVRKFKQELLEGFNKSASVRELFKEYLNIYTSKIDEKSSNIKNRFGISTATDKAMFFEKWHIFFPDSGKHYGSQFALDENSYLINAIEKNCETINETELNSTLINFKNKNDILILHIKAQKWFFNCKKFRPKRYKDVESIQITGFHGFYILDDYSIPVFTIYCKEENSRILILNKNKIGQLIQWSPLNEKENDKLLHDIFHINIQTFSDNETLKKNFIKDPPEWLNKIENEQKQQEHLEEKALIEIHERFEFIKDKNFQGYKVTLE